MLGIRLSESASDDAYLHRKFLQLRILAERLGLQSLSKAVISRNGAVDLFRKCLDDLSIANECSGWVEKTPLHFEKSFLLLDEFPTSFLFYLLRDGKHVVASIVDRGRKFPTEFSGQADPEYSIDLWNHSVEHARRLIDHPRVFFVSHESFCSAQNEILSAVGREIGLTPSKQLTNAGIRILTDSELWKNDHQIEDFTPVDKWTTIFNNLEREQIKSKLSSDIWCELRSARNLIGHLNPM
jgi:hypothetical protein